MALADAATKHIGLWRVAHTLTVGL